MTGKNKNDSRSKLKYPCGLRGEECKTNTIQCAKCEKWYHQQCTEVPPAIMAHLGKVKGLFWSCDACLGTPIKDNSALSVLEQKVEIITEQITSLSKTMNSLNPPTPMHKHEDQQQVTKRSVRVSGLPESTAKNIYERKSDDIQKLKTIIADIGVTDLKVNNIIRMGKFSEGRNRTLIVELPNIMDVELLVSKAIKAKLGNVHQVYISPDLTKEEREIEKKLLKKRRELIDSKEVERKDIKIRNLTLYVKNQKVDA